MPEEGKSVANAVTLKILEKSRRRTLMVVLKFKVFFLTWVYNMMTLTAAPHLIRDKNQKQKLGIQLFDVFDSKLCVQLFIHIRWPCPSQATQPTCNPSSLSPFERWLLPDLGSVPSGAAKKRNRREAAQVQAEGSEGKHAKETACKETEQWESCMASRNSCSLRSHGYIFVSVVHLQTASFTQFYYLFYVYVWFAYMYVCAPHECLVPLEVKRRHKIHWNWNYRWSWPT